MVGIDNVTIIVKKNNATHLHEEDIILTLKTAIPSIDNTSKESSLNDMCMKIMYIIIMMTVMMNLKTWIKKMSNSILMNWNILPSSLSGQVIWTGKIIRNRQDKKQTVRKNNSIITLAGTTDQRVLKNSLVVLISGHIELYGQEHARTF